MARDERSPRDGSAARGPRAAAGGADFLQLDLSAVAPRGRTTWLTEQIRQAILSGRLAEGARLPSSRALAADLGCARGTVVEAYLRLEEHGLVLGRAGAGTRVAGTHRFPADGTRTVGDSTARDDRRSPESDPEGLLDLATGIPDLSAFPRAVWLRAEREVLASGGSRELGYAPAEGVPALRAELAAWLTRSRGVSATPDQVMVTAGVSGALSLISQVLCSSGVSRMAIEDPASEGVQRYLRYWMPEVIPVPVDEDGLAVSELTRTAAQAVVVTPAHQFPTGVVLAPERRRALLAWAEPGRVVIEDDYDAEYRYDRSPVRALQPLAPNRVAYTASLSKTLAPALRLGWLVPPPHLLPQLVELAWATGLGVPALPQLTLARLLADGSIERHLRVMRGRHRVRRDAAVRACAEHLPRMRVSGVAAGLHLVLRFPDDVAEGADPSGEPVDVRVAARAREVGLRLQPLSVHCLRRRQLGLVLCYAAHPPGVLRAAVRSVGAVIRSELG